MIPWSGHNEGYGQLYYHTDSESFYLMVTCTHAVWIVRCFKLNKEEREGFDEDPDYGDHLSHKVCHQPDLFKDREISREMWLTMGGTEEPQIPLISPDEWKILTPTQRFERLQNRIAGCPDLQSPWT